MRFLNEKVTPKQPSRIPRNHVADPPGQVRRFSPGARILTCACGGNCPRCMGPEKGLVGNDSTAVSSGMTVGSPRNSPWTPPGLEQRIPVYGGKELEPTVRRSMESRFGRDFSHVRVHSDLRAAESAARIGARAYTYRNQVVFAHGQFAPHTPEGGRLLVHELTHVAQQTTHRSPEPEDEGADSSSIVGLEAEAARNAAAYSDGGPINVRARARPGSLQKSDEPDAHVAEQDAVTSLQARLKEQFGVTFDSAAAEQAIRQRQNTIYEHRLAPIRKALSRLEDPPIVIDDLGDEIDVAWGRDIPPAEIPPAPPSSGAMADYQQRLEDAKRQYETMLSSLRQVSWTAEELTAVSKALPYLGPLASRLTIGRFAVSVGTNDQGAWVTRPETFGEYIPPNTIAMFDRAFSADSTKIEAVLTNSMASGDLGLNIDTETASEEDLRQRREISAKQPEMITAVFIHEFAHSLAADPVLEDRFARETGGYWTFPAGGKIDAFGSKSYDKSGLSGAEKPVSSYGEESLKEDIADSILYYLAVPKVLHTLAPLRYKFVHALRQTQELIASEDIYREHPDRK